MLGDFRNPYHSTKKIKDIKANLDRLENCGTPFVDFEKVASLVKKNVEIGKSEIREIFGTIPLLDTVAPEYAVVDFFSCPLIFGNRGWFHKDSCEIWRYSTKSSFLGDVIDLDVVDLWAIYEGKSKKEKLTELSETFDIPLNSEVEAEIQRLKDVEENFQDFSKDENAIMTKDLKTIFEVLLIEAREKAIHQRVTKKGKPYFYVDLNAIRDQLIEVYGITVNRGSISRYVNLLATIGAVEKLPLAAVELKDKNVAVAISEEQRRFSNNFGKYITYKNNTINFYHIPSFDSQKVDFYVRKLIERQVRYYMLNRQVVEICFGVKRMNEVYPEHNNQNIKKSKFEAEKRSFKKRFFVLLKTQGYVAKSQMEGILPSKTMLDRYWTETTKSLSGVRRQRLSTLEKTEFRISSTVTCSVFLKFSLIHPMEKIEEKLLEQETVYSFDEEFVFSDSWLDDIERQIICVERMKIAEGGE